MTSSAVYGRASMLYAALGDALGYKNGYWEFNKSTADILQQASKLGGIQKITVNVQDWPVSDDTVMHLATAIALVQSFHPSPLVRSAIYNVLQDEGRFWNFALKAHECARILSKVALSKGAFGSSVTTTYLNNGLERFTPAIIGWYTSCMSIMDGRAPGKQTLEAVEQYLKKGELPDRFNARAGGNGAAMRTMCIGLLTNLSPDHLTRLSMIAGVATHPNVTALMGGCMSAALTHMAIGKIDPIKWLPLFYRYYYDPAINWLEDRFKNEWLFMMQTGDVDYFHQHVNAYYNARFDENGEPVFPADWLHNSDKRDKFYKSLAYESADGTTWNGSSGHDAVLIAYDCFLFSPYDWHTVAYLAALHGGDSDSTGTIAGAFFGAFNGMKSKTMVGVEFAGTLGVLGSTIATL